MIAKLVSFESGKGIMLPDPFLEKYHIRDNVDFEIKNDTIVIRSVQRKSRSNWEQAFIAMHKNGDDQLLIDDGLDWEDLE